MHPTPAMTAVLQASSSGGPMGRHALVGRASLLTPLRVCLLMAIVVLICGWLFKAACIQQGPNGAGGVTLDQGGQRPSPLSGSCCWDPVCGWLRRGNKSRCRPK